MTAECILIDSRADQGSSWSECLFLARSGRSTMSADPSLSGVTRKASARSQSYWFRPEVKRFGAPNVDSLFSVSETAWKCGIMFEVARAKFLARGWAARMFGEHYAFLPFVLAGGNYVRNSYAHAAQWR
jgi:hypothetical protein